jgi:anaerobic ribonucleoside-triphosphate reductase
MVCSKQIQLQCEQKEKNMEHTKLKVLSRDGNELRDFDLAKIEKAVSKAMDAAGMFYTQQVLDAIAIKALGKAAKAAANTELGEKGILKVEQIQDGVVRALYSLDYDDIADLYTSYRKAHSDARQIEDAANMKVIYNYTGERDDSDPDFKADPLAKNNNASQSFSVSGLHQYISGVHEKEFWQTQYDKVNPDIRLGDQDNDGMHYIHDYTMLTGYCAGWSLNDLIHDGIPSVAGTTAAGPAKHLDTLCVQMANFLGIMQSEWAGAQAFSSFDTYLAPFLMADVSHDFEYTYKKNSGDMEGAYTREYEIAEEAIQKFVYNVNVPSRWGSMPPFSNITLDWTVPDDICEKPCCVGGIDLILNGKTICYKDCKHEMDVINKAFLSTMIKGDVEGRGFQYPIPTYNITKDFDWGDTENNKLLFELTAKYGSPYFSNYINSDMKPSDTRSMCCRLRLDLRELRRKAGGNFGSGENTGSIGVVTLNMPLIAYRSHTKEEFYSLVHNEIELAVLSLNKKREVIQHYMDMGMYPYSKFYLRNNGQGTELKNHFSTVGVVGMNEMCLNIRWEKYGDLTEEKSRIFTGEVLDFIRSELSDYQEKYTGILYNLEATPAESTAHKLAREDKKRYPDIITAGTIEAPYYTNSSHLPVGKVDDIFEALDMEDPLQVKYTSGTVFHAFLGERLPDWKAAASLVRVIAENYKLPYYTLSPTYSICKDHGYISGSHFTCPTCGKPAQVFSRITGYYRPVDNFNFGKKEEFNERATFDRSTRQIPAKMHAIEDHQTDSGEIKGKSSKMYLFTTPTCPNCKMAKTFLQDMDVEIINANENMDMAGKYGVMQAPTLVIVDGLTYTKIVNVSNIKKFVDGQK